MKLLLLTDGVFPFVLGGMQKHSYNLLKYFSQEGIQVTLMHCVKDSSELISHQLMAETVNLSEDEFESHCFTFPQASKLPGHYLRNSKKLSEFYFERLKDRLDAFDFIFSQGFTAWEFLVNKELCPPIGIHFHGYNMFQKTLGLRSKLENHMLAKEVKKYALKSDFLFSLGGGINDIIKHNIGYGDAKILIAPNGIEKHWLNESKQLNDKLNFLFVGRFDKIKAVDLIYNSIQQIKGNVYFHFVGPIPIEHQLNFNNVYYHGSIVEEDSLYKIYEECDVLLCPSLSEGMPTVILEAMANGLAIIATDVGANKELVKENGCLIAPGDQEALTQAIEHYIQLDKQELRYQSNQSKSYIKESFLWEKTIKTTIDGILKVK